MTMQSEITFRDSQTAFAEAIAKGRLSMLEGYNNFVGSYMYMGTYKGKDLFKNRDTREYID